MVSPKAQKLLIGFLPILLALPACKKSVVDSDGVVASTPAAEAQVITNTTTTTETVVVDNSPKTWTSAHLAQALKTASQRMNNKLLPSQLTVPVYNQTLLDLPDHTAENKAEYDRLVDQIFSTPEDLEPTIRTYFSEQFAVTGEPVNLAAYIFKNDLPIDDLWTVSYSVDGNGNVLSDPTQFDPNGAPAQARAGVFTLREFLVKYLDTPFMFKVLREAFRLTLCKNYPGNIPGTKKFDVYMVARKYGPESDDENIICRTCHSELNPKRYAFRFFSAEDGTKGDWDETKTKGNNFWGMEPIQFLEEDVQEPLASGQPIPEAQAIEHFEFLEGQGVVDKPVDLINQYLNLPEYNECMTRRLLTIAMEYEKGVQAMNPAPLPYSYKNTPGEERFLNTMIDAFKNSGKRPVSFWKEFFKSHYFVNSVPNQE